MQLVETGRAAAARTGWRDRQVGPGISTAVLPGRALEFRRKRSAEWALALIAPVPAYLDLWPRTLYITGTCCRPALTDIRRGFEFPRTSSPLAGSSFKRGLGARGLFGFLKP